MTESTDKHTIDVVCVADGPRLALALAIHLHVSKKTNPDIRYHVAKPKGSAYQHKLAGDVIEQLATSIFEIPEPTTVIDGKPYRIENKIAAMRHFGDRPAILIDSDLLFMRRLPKSFLFRKVPAAVPEHGLHVFPWERMYSTLSLKMPEVVTILGSGEESPPWLNAGFVTTPSAEKLGSLWSMASKFVLGCDWIPEHWPYLDQISLPLALALFSETRTVNHDSILPSTFNDNIFYWHPNQSYASNSFVIHHHYRVGLLKKYAPNVISWVRDGNPAFDELMQEMSRFDDGEKK